MPSALIIGSGAAAAATALALSPRKDFRISVVDIGLQLETERQKLVNVLASSAPGEWDAHTVESISRQPADSRRLAVPEKRIFGSDYPFPECRPTRRPHRSEWRVKGTHFVGIWRVQ